MVMMVVMMFTTTPTTTTITIMTIMPNQDFSGWDYCVDGGDGDVNDGVVIACRYDKDVDDDDKPSISTVWTTAMGWLASTSTSHR